MTRLEIRNHCSRQMHGGLPQDATTSTYRGSSLRKNPFPGAPFFIVPTALYDAGLAPLMRPSQIIRYITLLRTANYNYYRPTQIGFSDLERLDGISKRAARDAHIKLAEYGLILVEKTNPFTYRLVDPRDWHFVGPVKTTFKRGRSLTVFREWV